MPLTLLYTVHDDAVQQETSAALSGNIYAEYSSTRMYNNDIAACTNVTGRIDIPAKGKVAMII